MTNTEATAILKKLFTEITKDYDVLEADEIKAFNMAISSLDTVQQTEKNCANCQHLDTFLCVDCKAENHWEQKEERLTSTPF